MTTKQQAFTLIEVLIALVILSIALTAIIISSSQATRDLQYITNKNIAHWLAMSQINRALISAQAPKNQQGQQQVNGKTWQWSQQITRIPHAIKIDLSVSLQQQVYSKLTVYRYVNN